MPVVLNQQIKVLRFRGPAWPGRAFFFKTCLTVCLVLFASAAFAGEKNPKFFDAEDGSPDVSGLLSAGGFIPVPVIITEPAVEGGLGIAGQFIGTPDHPGGTVGRTMD